jgi:hypothetical protein
MSYRNGRSVDSISKDYIINSFLNACCNTVFHHRWMTVDTWSELIVNYYKPSSAIQFNGKTLLNAVSKCKWLKTCIEGDGKIEKYHISLFMNVWRPSKGPRLHCVYATPLGEQPTGDNAIAAWHLKICSKLLEKKVTRSSSLSLPIEEGSTLKRKREIPQHHHDGLKDETIINISSEDTQKTSLKPQVSSLDAPPPSVHPYWLSTEAKILFAPKGNETVLEGIDAQIKILIDANGMHMSYLNVIDNPHDAALDEDSLSCYQVWAIQQRCAMLSLALKVAKEKMNGFSWEKCCELAIETAQAAGIRLTSRPRTVMEWYRHFRRKRKFEVVQRKKDNLPPFLQANPAICSAMQQYGKENLRELSIEMMVDYIHNTVLPNMIAEEKNITVEEVRNTEGYDEAKQKILRQYGLTKVCPSTVYKWMKLLGFTYSARRKNYYVDGHEKPATIEYRHKFCERYLQNELRTHRWIQVEKKKAEYLLEKGVVAKDSGYYYFTDDNQAMVEFHVDDSPEFPKMLKHLPFKGMLSVRKPPGRPLIIFGHDECIFKQYLMTNKSWKGPNGETAPVPKDEGAGLMISAFQSREFGFGIPLTEEQLNEINRYREGQTYVDEEAAMATRQTKTKKPLTISPFIQEFEYGQSNQGYWTYQWMVCQLDDCVDVLNVIFGEQYEFLFLFDHSCGHDKKRADGLIVENMKKMYGGKQPKMRSTEIQNTYGYLGQYPSILSQGSIQKMIFEEGDIGPFWMTEQQRIESKYDIGTGVKKKRELTIAELREKLLQVGYTASGRKKDLQQAAQARGIHTFEEIDQVKEGWLNKPKGLLQVCWERGLINPSIPNVDKAYTINGRKNSLGIQDNSLSLKYLLGSCLDFEEEETMLQSMGRSLGVLIDRTPKCHPELAGEGIEYSWGCAKNFYRRLPLDEKRRKEKFMGSVRRSMEREVLNQERVIKFSKRAREYIMSYHTVRLQQQRQQTSSDDDDPLITPMKIEKLIKEFKTHRCALDFEYKYIQENSPHMQLL